MILCEKPFFAGGTEARHFATRPKSCRYMGRYVVAFSWGEPRVYTCGVHRNTMLRDIGIDPRRYGALEDSTIYGFPAVGISLGLDQVLTISEVRAAVDAGGASA